jgi:hypothetical protein
VQGDSGCEKKIIKMVGPTFGGGSRGTPGMEVEMGNLEGYAKWRPI